MVSRIKILPSDVVLMIIDYLDSPTMMNCRQVCRSWLDVVESNRFLFNYFIVLDQDGRHTFNMLNFFSAKSHDSLKVFHLGSGTERLDPSIADATSLDYRTAIVKSATSLATTSTAIVKTLLKSRNSLKILRCLFLGSNYEIISHSLKSSLQFTNLESFFGQYQRIPHLRTRIKIGRGYVDGPTLVRGMSISISIFDDVSERSSSDLVRASALTLVHLNVNFNLSEEMDFNFPNLRVLELVSHGRIFDKDWNVPKLKVLTLGVPSKTSLMTNFPPSLEELWLVRRPNQAGTLVRNGLEPLKNFYPKMKVFKLEASLTVNQDEVIEVVKARKTAVEKGLLVDGIEMEAMKQLQIDFSKIDSETLSKLQGLVPEVVDARLAPIEAIIDC